MYSVDTGVHPTKLIDSSTVGQCGFVIHAPGMNDPTLRKSKTMNHLSNCQCCGSPLNEGGPCVPVRFDRSSRAPSERSIMAARAVQRFARNLAWLFGARRG